MVPDSAIRDVAGNGLRLLCAQINGLENGPQCSLGGNRVAPNEFLRAVDQAARILMMARNGRGTHDPSFDDGSCYKEHSQRAVMTFKFSVGQAVEYTPIGEKKSGLYRITRQMPQEEQAVDLRYRIKSEAEAYERNVLECHLSSDVGAESEYSLVKPRQSHGSRA